MTIPDSDDFIFQDNGVNQTLDAFTPQVSLLFRFSQAIVEAASTSEAISELLNEGDNLFLKYCGKL
jgi:hypothetical protein